ncbi:MAG TPA: hypothetical protein VIE43_03325 [Thermoanaerobaculia bacterium]|nr:hypothetical protein [Thermoanaerobaculia bacterium]
MTLPPRRVASLLGHRHVDLAIRCLGSLLKRSAEPLALRLHDDGSLDPEDRDRLAEALGEPEVIARREADERAAGVLARRPALAAFRRSNPLALKLVDAVLHAGDELLYCDADVLFLRPFSGLFSSGGEAAVFMADRQNAYSVRSWHLALHPRLRLAGNVNSGLIRFPTAAWDPDLLEWYFARPEFAFAPVWSEQTAWALLGWQAGCRLWDPRLVRLPEPGERGPGDAVALHFVTPLRGLLPEFLEGATDRAEEQPVLVGTVPARRCHSWDLAWSEVGRRWRRLTA